MLQSGVVNFTKPCVKCSNDHVQSVWHEKCHSVSATELHPTLRVHTSKSYGQHFHRRHQAGKTCQKSTSTKAAYQMLGK